MNLLVLLSRVRDSLRRRITKFYYIHTLCKYGKQIHFAHDVYISSPHNVCIGNNVTLNRGVILQASYSSKITISDNVSISFGSKLLTGGLLLSEGEAKPFVREHVYEDIFVGNNVWIAANVIVLPGVTINDNVIVAAGAVVTNDLESGYIYAGVPAVKLRKV